MQIPFEVTQRHILLSLNTGVWHSYRGEGHLALKHVEAVRSALAIAQKPPAETEELLGYADTIEALAASLIDDIERASRAAEKALNRLPKEQHRLRTSALLVQGFIYYLQLKLEEARTAYAQVIEAGQIMNDVTIITRALVDTGDTFIIEGKLRNAEATYQRCIQVAQHAGMGQLTSVANAYAGLSCVQLEQNRLAEAAQSAIYCIEHYELEQILPYVLVAQAVLVRAAALMDDSEVFQRAIRGIHNLLETYPASARAWTGPRPPRPAPAPPRASSARPAC
jgi:ATP/maltotriose-dependent transcriptional regulator MalT